MCEIKKHSQEIIRRALGVEVDAKGDTYDKDGHLLASFKDVVTEEHEDCTIYNIKVALHTPIEHVSLEIEGIKK